MAQKVRTDQAGKEELLREGVHKEELIESIIQLLKKADVRELDLIYRMAKNMIV